MNATSSYTKVLLNKVFCKFFLVPDTCRHAEVVGFVPGETNKFSNSSVLYHIFFSCTRVQPLEREGGD